MRKIETIEEMLLWLDKSRAGESAEYYRGFLYDDRQHRRKENKEGLKLADLAWKAYESSKVELVQKRNGDGDYSYIMQSLGVRSKIEGYA